MADDTPNTKEELADAAEAPAAGPKSSLLAKIKILLFVLAVIVAECVVAYLYLPSASETAALAGAAMGMRSQAEGSAVPQSKEEQEGRPADHVEVDLGSYTVTSFQPVSSTTLHITFHLYGTVKAPDGKEFTKRMEENQHRVREQVIVTVRSANIADLTDAGLGLVKRTILDKTNRTLGKPYLQTVIFSEFSFIEQ